MAIGRIFLFSLLCGAAPLTVLAQPKLDIPMDRELINVVVRCGLKAATPATWEGQYRVTEGAIIAVDGWRFAQNDYATLSEYKFQIRRFFPRFWNRRGRDPKSLPIEANGIVFTLARLTPASKLKLSTPKGEVSLPVGTLKLGAPRRLLDGDLEYQRLPVSRQIVQAPTEDGYPSATAGPDDSVAVAYIAFKHGEGFDKRPMITSPPKDFSFLAKPTGGERIMFTEFRNGAWSDAEPLTEPGGDLFGTAIARDGKGRLCVVWSANVDDNWDLYAKYRNNQRWSDAIRLTSAPGSDFFHVLVTDATGRLWLAWQQFDGTNSNILVAQQTDTGFAEPTVIAGSDANDWKPALAAASDGRVAVAWDTYARGDYDVCARIWKDGTWGQEHLIAATKKNEARASITFDPQNRLWVAFEESPEGWGKDYGPYDQSPKKTALYRERNIGIRVLDGGSLYAPKASLTRALPLPNGQWRWPKAASRVLAAGPQITLDQGGRIWLSCRIRVERFDSAVGGTWVTFLTTLDDASWRPAVMVPETDGFLHETSALVPARESGLRIVSASDGRFRTGAFFGLPVARARKRDAGVPPRATRNYTEYPDWQFNKEIAVADTGTVAHRVGPYALEKFASDAVLEPSAAEAEEAKQVAAIRDYRVNLTGASLRIVRGEFHRHTEISSDGAGDGSLFDMWRYAIDMASLDWIGNGDHDNGNGREFSWWFTQKTTSLFTVPGAFMPMYTYERSCNYPDGHRNPMFAKRGIRPLARLKGGLGKAMDNLPADALRPSTPDTQMLYDYLHFFDGVCASHTSGTDMGTDWRNNDPQVEPVVEIYQGDRQSYERPGAPRTNTADYSLGGWRPYGFVSLALLKGYRLGFQSSSDHISTHMSYCNVWVEEPTREAILEGLKRRRVYGATDNIIADVRCGEHFMGEEFTIDKPPTLRVKLIGTAPFAEVVIIKNNQYVYTMKPDQQEVEFQWTDTQAKPNRASYYYVRGTQVGQSTTRRVSSPRGGRVDVELNNGEIVWVSPMWITFQP